MPRPLKCRRVCLEPEHDCFTPDGIVNSGAVCLTVDEYEVIRLVDFEGKTHEQAAAHMSISRTTVTEMYETARYKLADCLVNGRRLIIAGGNYSLCKGDAGGECGRVCRRGQDNCEKIIEKGNDIMRIAVTYENGEIFQHFGHTEQFKLYDTENGAVTAAQIVPTNGSGHGALAQFLASNSVDVLICGGIGGGAQQALAEAGIKLYGGASGDADTAVNALLSGSLSFDPNVHCTHHDGENASHDCNGHHGEGHICGGHCGN